MLKLLLEFKPRDTSWIDASDRIADSIGTLAHVLARDAARASG